jgi:UDP-glucuronate 4-epimerase
MNILVTGGAGFIGSHLVEKLLVKNHRIIVIDNFDPFYDSSIKERNLDQAKNFKNFKLYRNDILDEQALHKIFTENSFDLIVHIAAKAGVRPSIANPSAYYQTNVQGTVNLLEKCKQHGIKKFIFASTSSIYGNNEKVPFSENDPVDFPISPYAATKKAAELICYTYYHLYHIDIHALRFFTVYGPRQRPDLAIHKFFKLIWQNKPIQLYGDGSTSRDYTYIDDIIDGVLKSIEGLSGFEIINLGESQTITLRHLVEVIEQILGKKAYKEFLPMQPGDVRQTFADISKAKRLLGYDPHTSIEQGLADFYEWFKQNYAAKDSDQ